ncbi:MAG: M90 family metallopeptidase [Verrucomicrobiota bacterium]
MSKQGMMKEQTLLSPVATTVIGPQEVALMALVLVPAVWILCLSFSRKRRRRRKLMRAINHPDWFPWPDHYEHILRENIPLASELSERQQRRLRSLILFFIKDKRFEACGGLEGITDTMRVVIAAHACLLLLNHHHDCFPNLRSILVYPSRYFADDENGDRQERLGESWGTGSVVLAWDSTLNDAWNPDDGLNVAIHEFAHQLDQATGGADGLPSLRHTGNRVAGWARVLGGAYDNFLDKVDRGRPSSIDDYGATDPAEFFAVATETFFEKPDQLRREYPSLYEELTVFYAVDLAES